MHLKSLSIHGFKSFANPTEFDLDEGLTAIVGPNGCGKSNVIDAVRWAMGEQSARSLRGANMQDIIFNGGGKRGPLGMAEVTLRFSNKDRLLDIDRDEVRFTRRLYRDGTSEYLINSNKARLKDFKELLMDTGAGAKGMVFVEQGRIDALLHASPAERRHVLEEAAGIGKFKVRKHEAQNRLKHVAVDRARLSDLLREVEARYKELKKQANKAKRYVEVREQLQKVQIELSRFRNHDYQAVTESARERVVRFGERQEKEDRKLHKVTVELDGLARDVRERERAVRDLELTLRDLSASEKVRREQAFEEGRRAAECNEDHARGAYQLKGLQEKQARLGREIEASESKLQKRKTDDAGLATRIEELEAKVEGEGQAQKKLREGLDRSRSKLMATLQEEAKLRNRAAELEARARVLAGREERLERRIKEVREGLALREAERSSLKAAIEAAVTRVEELDRDLDRTTEARDEAEETIRDLEESFLTERRALDHTSARLTVLEQLDKEGAGLDPGVKAVLALTSGEGDPDPAHEDAPNGNEVIGALGDLIRPDADYALALEMLLGPTAQWIAVSTQESATEIASWLQREEIGRCRLLPLDTYLERTSKAAPPKLKKAELRKLDEAGFLGWAAEIAQPAPEVLPVLRRLFHRYAIVEDMESALAIVALPAVEGAVTLEGEVVHACGSIEGGVSQSAGRIGRRSERKALEQERVEQEESLHRMQAGLSRWREAEKEAAQKLEQLRTEHHEQKLQAFSLKRDGEERERLLLRSREEDRLATEERDEIRDDRRIALEEREELEREAIVLREDAQDLEERAREQAEALTEVEDELAREREELSVLKVRMARTAEQWEALRNQAKRAAEELADTSQQIEAMQADQQRGDERTQEARQRKEALEAEIERLVAEQQKHDVRLKSLRTELSALSEKVQTSSAKQTAAREALLKARAGLDKARREGTEAKQRLEELEAQVQADLGMTLEDLGAPAKTKPGQPPYNPKDADRQIGSFKRQLNLMGNVNLEALEECDRLERRSTELSAQVKDLTGSEENLRATIKRLNETSRKKLKETFTIVQQHFRLSFRKLFGGGKADLKLEAGVDILEAGVDIYAKPPGKEARTISLLSGGEKVLATVALLFAIFQAKPQPFCILDEVDAALDEHNVGRFVSLVREFSTESQFLIVTHNKKTMSAADALYGVTMPEPGVSTPVSVRLEARKPEREAVTA